MALVYNVFWYRFQFLKACGSCLKVPSVDSEFHWTSERVKMISQSSDLYIKSQYPLLPSGDSRGMPGYSPLSQAGTQGPSPLSQAGMLGPSRLSQAGTLGPSSLSLAGIPGSSPPKLVHRDLYLSLKLVCRGLHVSQAGTPGPSSL